MGTAEFNTRDSVRKIFFFFLCAIRIYLNVNQIEKTEIQIVNTMVLVLKELQKIFKATNATFEKLMVCLSCVTRFNLETLLKGYKEGAGMEGIRGIVKRIVQIENRDG